MNLQYVATVSSLGFFLNIFVCVIINDVKYVKKMRNHKKNEKSGNGITRFMYF